MADIAEHLDEFEALQNSKVLKDRLAQDAEREKQFAASIKILPVEVYCYSL